mgnify:CR=1 FL=1
MKKLLIIIAILTVCNYVVAQTTNQDCTDCFKQPCYDCYDSVEVFKPHNFSRCDPQLNGPYINERLRLRARNYDFHNTLRYLQPPSLLSGGTLTSYTFNNLGYDKKNFVLDANVQFPIAIGGKRFGLNTIQVIPQFKVRIFQDDENVPFGPNGDISIPVRTPSTIPGLAYYFSFDRWWDPTRRYNKELKRSFDRKDRHEFRDNKYLGIYIFHHSDGQDGSEIYPNDSVNIYNGNYGEQAVFEFIYGQQRKFVASGNTYGQRPHKKKVISKNQVNREIFIRESQGVELNWRVSFEWHPYKISNEVFRDLSQLGPYPERSRMLGRTRLNARASVHLVPKLIEYLSNGKQWCLITPGQAYERWRFMLDFSYILDNNYFRGPNINELEKVGPLGLNRRLNLTGSVYHVLKRSKYVAAFAKGGYIGNDRYNIYFNQSLWELKFGLAFGFFNQPEQQDRY